MKTRLTSAGLTLVNATHVYLCEPLLNTALELQAISRVHRIGQMRPTTVWQFTISSTVEESIFRLSSEKRLNVVQSDNMKKELTQSNSVLVSSQVLDAANSYQLSNVTANMMEKGRAGEHIDNDDLWKILFEYNNNQHIQEHDDK